MAVINTPNGFRLDAAGTRVVVDPVTRIEGHMRCEVNLDANNVITNAVSTGTMWRGLEVILKGRDPRDAWAFVRAHLRRLHRHARADLGARGRGCARHPDPGNANSIRNLMQLTLQAHDHLVHFYHLHALDWVNLVNALKADPKATSDARAEDLPLAAVESRLFPRHPDPAEEVRRERPARPVQERLLEQPAYRLPAEVDLLAVAHYLKPSDFQRARDRQDPRSTAARTRIRTGWSAACRARSTHTTGAVGAINMERLNHVSSIIDRTREFIDQVYLPDLMAIALVLQGLDVRRRPVLEGRDVLRRHSGAGQRLRGREPQVPHGAIIGGDLRNIQNVDVRDPAEVQEFVDHSWYRYPEGAGKGRHPWEASPSRTSRSGRTPKARRPASRPSTKAPSTRGSRRRAGRVTRSRSGRWRAGIIGYAQNRPSSGAGRQGTPRARPAARSPVLDRRPHASPAARSPWAAAEMRHFQDKLVATIKAGDESTANVEKWDPSTWPKSAKGVGFTGSPRGALGHWVRIEDGRIESYQAVVPTTWNASPRDVQGNIGAYEAAKLLNTPVARADEPVEILRTLHSFDPCLACSTHVMGPDGEELSTVRVR